MVLLTSSPPPAPARRPLPQHVRQRDLGDTLTLVDVDVVNASRLYTTSICPGPDRSPQAPISCSGLPNAVTITRRIVASPCSKAVQAVRVGDQALVSRGITLTVAERACVPIIGLRYGLARYFAR